MNHTRSLRAWAMGVAGVLIAAGAIALPSPAIAAPTASITGAVSLPAGITPAAAHAEVFVYSAAGEFDPIDWEGYDQVDPDGTFALEGLEPGDYKLRFTTYDAGLAEQWWQGADDFESAQVITLDEGEAFTASESLEAGATVAGKITGGMVSEGWGWALAFRQESAGWWNEGYSRVGTDGRFLIDGLRPGTYKILFSDNGGYGGDLDGESITGWQEWWNDSMSFEAALAVTITAQEALTGFDVNLDTVEGQYTWPKVSGTPKVGNSLTVSAGAWPAGTTLKYRWYADGTEIAGAKSSKLTLTSAHYGKRIDAGVFGLKPGEDTYQMKFSAQTSKVAIGTLTSATPTISGTLAAGATLTAKPGTWTTKTSFSYQWYADGKAISTATKSTLKVPTSLVGKTVKVKVTGKKTAYTTTSKTSASTKRVALAPTPKISGSAKIGSKLTVTAGTWTSGTRLTYRWYANGASISGATKTSYTVTSSQAGKAITVKVTGTKSGYATVTKTSKATAKVLKVATPTISGTKIATLKLTVKPGTWASGTSFSYRWYANGAAISGANAPTLTLKNSQVGKRISVQVTGKKRGYTSVSKMSSLTSKIKPSKAPPASKTTCPAAYPIKGNQTTRHTTDWIYHVPGGQYYNATHPEECFATESAARAAGYRAAKV